MFGKIPRFSPSFTPSEAAVAVRYLSQDGPNDDVVRKFEQEFASFIGARHAVMVPSARYGFYLLLKAFGVKEDDEIIIPALTYFAIPAMVPLLNARPVFADIGHTTHVLDPASFEAAITDKTVAVVPTHLFGTPCDMDAINAIAKKHGIHVIEDCAQSTGARYQHKRVGQFGDAAYYTFGLTKNITTLSGAMITTDREDIAASVRGEIERSAYGDKGKLLKEVATGLAMYIATHPRIYWATVHPAIVLGNKLGKDPIHERFGEAERRYETVPEHYQNNGRAHAVQAAIGMRQLNRIEQLNGARMRNGRALDNALANIPGLTVPSYPAGAEPIYMSFVVHHRDRDALTRALRSRGVDTTVGYMSHLADHPLFQEFTANCPNAADAAANLLHIPVHPNLNERDINHMAEAVRASCMELGS